MKSNCEGRLRSPTTVMQIILDLLTDTFIIMRAQDDMIGVESRQYVINSISLKTLPKSTHWIFLVR